ncbi:MAG: tetratricopeptide repeat protein [Magnetospirillum sp.]|nr:tetratricopeptide repeat protein [Magnetospirillum sp.]
MARILVTLMAFILLGASTACSPKTAPHVPDQASLDHLFERLHLATSDQEARLIEATIRHAWIANARPEARKLMGQAITLVHHGELEAAEQVLDRVVEQAPTMVAAWNLRATIRYAQDDTTQALSDIAVTLKLEPRHFGAWAGLGLIMLEQGHKQAALRAFETALRFNPHMTDLWDDVHQLRQELSGIPA